MKNFYNNYITVVKTNIGDLNSTSDKADATKLVGRTDTARPTIYTTLFDELDTTRTKFDTVLSSLTTQANDLLNPTTGAIVGSHCLIMGEDAVKLVDTICTRTFNQLYVIAAPLSLIAFGMLFAMCCSVCTGVRMLNNSEKLS